MGQGQQHRLTAEQTKRIAAEVAEIVCTVARRDEGFPSDARVARIVRDVINRQQDSSTQGGRI